jgi:ATP-dependent Clp protease protease subunit
MRTKSKPEPETPEAPETWEIVSKQTSQVDDTVEMTLLKNNTIVLHGELTEDLCNKVCKRLLYLAFSGAKEIKIILNSVGGEVYHGLLLFNTLEDLKKRGIQIDIEARGLCASMGVLILMGGSIRTASKYTRFLLHETSSFTYGKVSEMKEGVEELERLNTMLDEIIIERTKINATLLKNKTRKREWWLSAEEALKYGIISKIV